MDKKGIIQEHSKIKLELYKLYLRSYLAILSNIPAFKKIDIYDIFAGCGVSDNNEEGSAIIAAKEIKEITVNNNTISLRLNEYDINNYEQLKKHVEPYKFISITNKSADEYINSWRPANNTHNLFFIDPYGYTQIETKNLEQLFQTKNCDFLIFIPLNSIYRFLKPADKLSPAKTTPDFFDSPDENKSISETENNTCCKPIAHFLKGLNIGQLEASAVNSCEEFADTIVNAFRGISKSEFVYYQLLENENRNNKYALFFVSHHILGAEKFLEAQRKVLKNKLEKKDKDTLFSSISPDNMTLRFIANTPSILDIVDYKKKYTNVMLYELGIKHGILPTELNKELKKLEKERKIQVETLPQKLRNQSAFYINNKNYKNQKHIITVTFMK